MDLCVSKIYEVLSREEEQQLNETVITILTCLILCDREKHLSEVDALKKIAKSLSWHSDEPIEIFLGSVMRKVGEKMHSSDYREYFSELCARITNKQVKEQLIEAAGELALVDGEVSASEKAKIDDMSALFGTDK